MKRILSFDVAKGIAICLVVTFHSAQGLTTSKMMQKTFAEQAAQAFAYAFHVQIFFLLAGYFTFSNARSWSFQIDRFASLYYSYLLWAGINIIVLLMMPGGNHEVSVTDLLWLPVVPILHYWFILTLIIVTISLAFVRENWQLALLSLVAMVLAAFHYDPYPYQVAYFFPFVALGAYMRKADVIPPVKLGPAIVAGLVLLGVSVAATSYQIYIKSSWLMPVSLGGCYMLYVLSDYLAPTRVGQVLIYIGERSLIIYLAQGLFMTPARIIWSHALHGRWPLMAWVFIVTAGVTGPLVLAAAAQWTKLDYLAGFRAFRPSKFILAYRRRQPVKSLDT